MQLSISEILGITCSLSAELCSRNLSHVGIISDVTLDTTPFARKFVFTQCLGNAGATPCFELSTSGTMKGNIESVTEEVK
jgi:hypothetical protein